MRGRSSARGSPERAGAGANESLEICIQGRAAQAPPKHGGRPPGRAAQVCPPPPATRFERLTRPALRWLDEGTAFDPALSELGVLRPKRASRRSMPPSSSRCCRLWRRWVSTGVRRGRSATDPDGARIARGRESQVSIRLGVPRWTVLDHRGPAPAPGCRRRLPSSAAPRSCSGHTARRRRCQGFGGSCGG